MFEIGKKKSNLRQRADYILNIQNNNEGESGSQEGAIGSNDGPSGSKEVGMLYRSFKNDNRTILLIAFMLAMLTCTLCE